MATYTIQLRKVCDIYTRTEVENWFKDYQISDYLTSSQIEVIENTGLWNKEKLARKIVDHYFMREIGLETPTLFKHYAKVKMQEIMETKLPLIYSNAIQYDPLVNVDYTETFERNIKGDSQSSGNSKTIGKSESNSENKAEGLNITNDTPQTNITKQDLETGVYASGVTQSDTQSNIKDNTNTSNENNVSNNGTSNTDENYTKHVKGNSGVSATAQKMIEQFRENIIAIDTQIINELNSLFMGIY